MENEEKKGSNIIIRILFVLVIIFICLYSIERNGFVEKSYENKTLYTEEQIKKYENDIKSGAIMDEVDYHLNEVIDYSNESSRLGEAISNLITKGSRKSIEMLKNFFSYLFE